MHHRLRLSKKLTRGSSKVSREKWDKGNPESGTREGRLNTRMESPTQRGVKSDMRNALVSLYLPLHSNTLPSTAIPSVLDHTTAPPPIQIHAMSDSQASDSKKPSVDPASYQGTVVVVGSGADRHCVSLSSILNTTRVWPKDTLKALKEWRSAARGEEWFKKDTEVYETQYKLKEALQEARYLSLRSDSQPQSAEDEMRLALELRQVYDSLASSAAGAKISAQAFDWQDPCCSYQADLALSGAARLLNYTDMIIAELRRGKGMSHFARVSGGSPGTA